MPKRILDGESLWANDKLSLGQPKSFLVEYAHQAQRRALLGTSRTLKPSTTRKLSENKISAANFTEHDSTRPVPKIETSSRNS